MMGSPQRIQREEREIHGITSGETLPRKLCALCVSVVDIFK
jgi:hypothetical protein